VTGATEDITDAIPALNNMTQVYNINVAEVEGATVSGVPSTAVRGRDFTMKVVPSSAAYRIDLCLNGDTIVRNASSINQTFVAMEDMAFDINVYDPKEIGVLEMTVAPGTFHVQLTENNVCATVVVKGEVYSSDIQHATGKDFAIRTIKTLDLRGVKIVAQEGYEANVLNHPFFVYPTNSSSTPKSVVENLLLPESVSRIAGGVFQNCAKIKEVTLPASLKSIPVETTTASGGKKTTYALASDVFKGCTSLTTIYIPGEPDTYNGRQVVAHHNPYSTTNSFWYQYYNLGHEDPKKVTVIVPEEYLSVYTTAYNNDSYGNPWKAHGYNILSKLPVFGVNFDPSRISAADGVDVTAIGSFLGDNVALDELTVSDKLKLTNPSIKCRVYD
ncbi:MAG: leucine-rich repeat domain-containing protein, partial [Duncaniella sp.]|nr:leucine-rich repeat domain-containing protein [Duncaniella sp.]